MRKLLPLFLICVGLLISCSSESSFDYIAFDGEVTPTMVTTDVNSFVSDSGITRYHITAPTWQMYEEAKEPFWYFPTGLKMERYTNDMEVESSITADTARFLSRQKLWKLTGDVRIRNSAGDKILTRELYWNQISHKVYSDSFIHIERGSHILEGYGFISDEQITSYTIRRPSGIFPTNEYRNTQTSTTEAE